MEHEVASKSQAVERYLLGEMAQDERDAFEEHYFTCAECADEVRSCVAMAGDLKRVLRDVPQPRDSASWLSWLKMPALVPACAAAFLAAVVGYQNFAVLPQLKAPRPVGAAVILDGQTRGGGPKVNAGEPLHFQMAAGGAASDKPMWLELQGPGGQRIEAGEIPAPAEHQPLDVFFPGNFGPGSYTVVIRENPGGKEIARNPFEIVNKESMQ
jgi:hypothetical protein